MIKEAARKLRKKEYTNIQIKGGIIKLESKDTKIKGKFVIRTIIDGQTKPIWCEVDSKEYTFVIEAYKNSRQVSLHGDLIFSNSKWVLLNPNALKILNENKPI